ncbi:MAG: hypothetical protein ACJAQ6_000169 [Arenicella sp.]|jgi:hypothetical protein
MLFRDDPSLFKTTVLKAQRCSRTLAVAFLLLSISTQNAIGAQGLEPKRMAGVMAALNMLLLDAIPEPNGDRVEVGLSTPISGPITVSDAAFAVFDNQGDDVEFCLDILANQTLQSGDIIVEVNGVAAPVFEGKDNCYSIPTRDQRSVNYILVRVVRPGLVLTLTRLELASLQQTQFALPKLSRGQWNERAVRKVLKIFAFGGHAQGQQIQAWADMDSLDAIKEMLNFDEHNLKLSPLAIGETYTDSATQHGTLLEWVTFLSSESSNIPIPLSRRDSFSLNSSGFDDAFNRMITVRGLNPFRQRIGFWETNYHLATNLDAAVSRAQMARYFDIIMQAHEAGLPYHKVMAIAAKSAAVAEQYGHDRNRWRFDRSLGEYTCQCNEDFAREIHQLFYGIFGDYDPIPGDGIDGPDFHENVTIPNTAKMLTGMPILDDDSEDDGLVVDFRTSEHYQGNGIDDGQGDATPLLILGQTVSGADASAKIDSLMQISMQHPESLKNLPVMIVAVLADDNLSEKSKNQLREAWASMPVGQKNLLQFIRAYAVSQLLHGPSQVKYLTSHERALFIANKHNIDNLEAFFGGATYDGGRAGRSVGGVISDDDAGEFFRPTHNVFGGQTGQEAADSALVFENNFNLLTDREDLIRNAVACDRCDLGGPWEKKWPTVLPQRADGKYYVEDIAPWLWNHVTGSMENYTELERAHLYSLLGAARIDIDDDNDGDYAHDFNMVMCVIADYQIDQGASDAPIIDILTHDVDGSWDNYCREFDDGGSYLPHELAALNAALTGDDIASNPQIQDILSQLGQVTLNFNETEGFNRGANVRKHARERVSSALGFIFTTPFVFAEGQ